MASNETSGSTASGEVAPGGQSGAAFAVQRTFSDLKLEPKDWLATEAAVPSWCSFRVHEVFLDGDLSDEA